LKVSGERSFGVERRSRIANPFGGSRVRRPSMELELADGWWMGGLVALTGIVLLALNARSLGPGGNWAVSILSTAAATFVTALGMALTVQRAGRNV
jgi:hypothetical protein